MILLFVFSRSIWLRGWLQEPLRDKKRRTQIMIVTNKENLIKASAGGYAIPAINTQGGNFDIIQAVCQAAEELKTPIILAHYVSTGA